ncbi:MAG: transcription antitermination factor NusB [Gammaproteobacteria bacterium]|nr:transcription antitermination factor NusB [Gammaproteobacteria bacterium]
MSKALQHKRHWSRRFALQSLYQWQLAGHGVDELMAQFAMDENWHKVDKEYFDELLRESIGNAETLTGIFASCVNGSIERIDPVEKAILLYATYEILNKSDVPRDVVISEAVILCKKFGSAGGYKLVNGILDKVAKDAKG